MFTRFLIIPLASPVGQPGSTVEGCWRFLYLN
jgi:hypothetical protein